MAEMKQADTSYEWQRLDDDGISWRPKLKSASIAIEKLKIGESHQHKFPANGQTYKITKLTDSTAKQINVITYRQRKVRRIKIVHDDIKWEYKDDKGKWKPKLKEASDNIERLKIGQSYQHIFPGNGQTYKITKLSDHTAEQINVYTHKKRQLRRTKIALELKQDYPEWFDKSKFGQNSNYAKPFIKQVNMYQSPGKDVVSLFNRTCSDKIIVKIQSIQNQMLYDSYLSEKKKLIKLVGENNINERNVFHGTKQIDVMKTIYTQGFMKVFNSAAVHGMGTYFARDASYSADGYAGYDKSTKTYQMFQCEIITGESHKGSGSYKLTSWPKKKNGLIYDSLVDNMNNPSIFVLHENARAYPMFIIHFKET